MTAEVVYGAVFVAVFFVASFLLARYTYEAPTEPTNFLLLFGVALIWPITVPLAVVATLLLCVARLAMSLAGK